ncbi:hypothetical protein PIB30_023779 [Stylosanthes scabra]|uniref:KIB1-4 beta-propeller domain-containing protein n=1 Tax=Stylosanthes scabra TaxID=79078 RepID=A0ABU6Y9Y9_9FABA|nr:hypothetical protein [Stylosanthes scabra]
MALFFTWILQPKAASFLRKPSASSARGSYVRPPTNSGCCGSSYGWLFFVDNKSAQIDLLLKNPFASESEKSLIKLPPIQCDPTERVSQMDEYGVNKAILSKDPNEFPNDFEVIAIYEGTQMLAHYKSGDQFWSYAKPTGEIQCFADVIFYKGMAYAVDFYS